MAEAEIKIYHSLLMEIRPRLQSVNVYIVLKEISPDLKIVLNNNDFDIIAGEKIYKIPCEDVNIVPESLNSLEIKGLHVSFRFQTNNNFASRFKFEFLQPVPLEKYVNKNINWLKKNTVYSLFCANCSQKFCTDVSFQRVLPLPSENLDLSNWFCHGHSVDANTNLNPKANDLFYTETYVHLSDSVINDKIIKSNKIIVCKRCLFWLGLKMSDSVLKIWYNTVGFKSGVETYNSSPLNDINLVVNEILRSSFLNMAKIIFHCQVSNNVKNFILLWIIEKKLNIVADEKHCDVAKVLFRFEEQENATIAEWEKESVTSVVGISKCMMVDLLKHLYKINRIFPKGFNVTNGFFVSYLFLYDSTFL